MRRHLSYANVMSTLAVFLVLAGGTALAAGLRKNSVGSRAVKDNSLQSVDLKDGAGVSGADVAGKSLTGADVADNSLTGADVADGSLKGADVADGSLAGADLGNGAVGLANIVPNAVNSSNVVDGSIQGSDIGSSTITGANINESTLFQVPDAAKLNGQTPEKFLASAGLVEAESPLSTGAAFGSGTFKLSKECPTGSALVAGGALNLNPGTTVIEDGPEEGPEVRRGWTVRINPHGATDEFNVRVLCGRSAS
jgi:hypothetical protein